MIIGYACGTVGIEFKGRNKEEIRRFGIALSDALHHATQQYSIDEKYQYIGNIILEDIIQENERYIGSLKYTAHYNNSREKHKEHRRLATNVVENIKSRYPNITYKIEKRWN